jgi:hypothetical protein
MGVLRARENRVSSREKLTGDVAEPGILAFDAAHAGPGQVVAEQLDFVSGKHVQRAAAGGGCLGLVGIRPPRPVGFSERDDGVGQGVTADQQLLPAGA